MGETILIFYRSRVKKNWKIAFYAVLVIGLLTHLYKFTNTLLNHDALFHTYTPQNAIGSGRWFLTVACGLSSFFDLPWVNGLLSLLWIGATAAVIADIFDLRNPVALVLAGGLLVTFPCVTNTFFYEFAADGYMLAMLLAALTVRFSLVGERRKSRLVLAGLCLCFSCGIYQAYVSFALILSVCHMLWELLQNRVSAKETWRWVGRIALVYGGGLLAYWILWNLLLRLEGVAAAGYQGMDQIGQIGLVSLLAAGKEMALGLSRFFFGGNIFAHGLTFYAVLNILFLLLMLGMLVVAVRRAGLLRQRGKALLFLLGLLAIPFFVFLWLFVSPTVSYHMLMLQSLCVLYVFTLVLCERYLSPRIGTLAGLFFALLVMKFSLQANVCYFEMDKCMEHSRATAIEMLTRVHEADEDGATYIAFLGGGDQSLVKLGAPGVDEILVCAHQLRSTLLFDNIYAPLYLQQILDCPFLPVDEEALARLEASGVAADMKPWPAQDSIRVVGDTVVILLPPVEENEN